MDDFSLPWIEADQNPFGVRVLDVSPVTLGILSTSRNPQVAANTMSFGSDDGTSFIGQEPPTEEGAISLESVNVNLTYPTDGVLLEGSLFTPNKMEHKWAVFYHQSKMIFVRSWQRKVSLVADVEQHEDSVTITKIRGRFAIDNETPALTARLVDFVLLSHVQNVVLPVPLAKELFDDKEKVAFTCMSLFGTKAVVAMPDDSSIPPDKDAEIRRGVGPLRSHSLMHIAVARGKVEQVKEYLEKGWSPNLLAADGLSLLHWALAAKDPIAMMKTVLANGKDAIVDVRSHGEGATPLMNAVQNPVKSGNNLEVLQFLVDHGADVNAADTRGFTCLHRACEMGKIDVVQWLLDHQADTQAVAMGQHTPLSLAQVRQEQAVIDLLARHASNSKQNANYKL